jgi:hypothetical protein
VRTTTFRVVVVDLAVACDRAAFVAFGAGRRLDVRLVAARAGGFRTFLTIFAAGRFFDAVRFRLAVFFAVRPRPAAFRAPPAFFAPERRGRGARAAFRLAMDRPFARLPSYLDCFR